MTTFELITIKIGLKKGTSDFTRVEEDDVLIRVKVVLDYYLILKRKCLRKANGFRHVC
ncbi:MAG TPA: hypothetical protein VJP58_04015 [Candidatus Nitrosocosmicus sp.]|nr:hypothetical protein [Candidatus Nitrosocosmicus sp.]